MVALVKHGRQFPEDPDATPAMFNPDPISRARPQAAGTSYRRQAAENGHVHPPGRSAGTFRQDRHPHAIDELGHVMTAELGHTDTFWSNNQRLPGEVIQKGSTPKRTSPRPPSCIVGSKNSIV
jgi:hypothetical protein